MNSGLRDDEVLAIHGQHYMIAFGWSLIWFSSLPVPGISWIQTPNLRPLFLIHDIMAATLDNTLGATFLSVVGASMHAQRFLYNNATELSRW